MARPNQISGGISHAIFTSVVRVMDEHDLQEVRIGELHIVRRMKDPERAPVVLPPPEVKATIAEHVEKAAQEDHVSLDEALEASVEYQMFRLGALNLKQ